MKKIILIIALLAAEISIQAQLQNPDFEQTENNLPSGWDTKSFESYQVKSDDVVKQSGKNSFQISSTADASGKIQAFSQMFPLSGSGFRKVRLSGYIRSENTTGNIALWAQVKNAKKTTIDLANSETQNDQVTPNTDWKKYSLDFLVDDDAKNILCGGLLFGNGKVWFNNFSFSEIPFS